MIIEQIIARCEHALAIARHKKHADIHLYHVLKDCLEICEVCLRDRAEEAALDRLLAGLPTRPGKNRCYVEKGSDIYQKVCRYMFHAEEHPANTNRYAITLREAAARQIGSATLVQALKTGGGINALYLQRPLERDVVSTKCLRLDRQITHRKSERFTLVLKRRPDNSYEVLA